MIAHLRSGVYSALVLDAPILEYTAGTNEECDLFLVGEVFESFSIAFAFPTAFDDATIFAFSKAIVSLQVRLCTAAPDTFPPCTVHSSSSADVQQRRADCLFAGEALPQPMHTLLQVLMCMVNLRLHLCIKLLWLASRSVT
jgi:hypothetical protein